MHSEIIAKKKLFISLSKYHKKIQKYSFTLKKLWILQESSMLMGNKVIIKWIPSHCNTKKNYGYILDVNT